MITLPFYEESKIMEKRLFLFIMNLEFSIAIEFIDLREALILSSVQRNRFRTASGIFPKRSCHSCFNALSSFIVDSSEICRYAAMRIFVSSKYDEGIKVGRLLSCLL